MTDALPDPVPLGVSGAVTLSRAAFAFLGGDPGRLLLDEPTRLAAVTARLAAAMRRPLTAPGSVSVVDSILRQHVDDDPLPRLAEKILESLRDGDRHSRAMVLPGTPRLVVQIVAWNGANREVEPLRYATYLPELVGAARQFAERVPDLAGVLQIDAFARDEPDPADPAVPPSDTFELDVEFSYLPGLAFDGLDDPRSPRLVIVNRELCTPEQRQSLAI